MSGKLEALHAEIRGLRTQHPRLSMDEAFGVWFLRAFLAEREQDAIDSICGEAGDKAVDAVFVDDKLRLVALIQSKYRTSTKLKGEKRADVLDFAAWAERLAFDDQDFATVLDGMAPQARQRVELARERVEGRKYQLQLYYVTLGSISAKLAAESGARASRANEQAMLECFGSTRVVNLYRDWIEGVAPPVPMLDLRIEQEAGAGVVFRRRDQKANTESWIFSMNGDDVAELFQRSGTRLFARNIRGYLGASGVVNRGIIETIQDDPDRFWYYNNGITLVCDEARRETRDTNDILRVTNPQIINGQQTTRNLAATAKGRSKVSVLMRVIRVNRQGTPNGDTHFEELVSRIVSATNSQNAVRPSDLMANDGRQIDIERAFRKLNYWYIRKRQTKGEARRAAGRNFWLVKREELARATATCEIDPAEHRSGGTEVLFSESLYPRVFPTSDPWFYLKRYWVMTEVDYRARGDKALKYGRWLVLRFIWNRLDPELRSKARTEAFRSLWESRRESDLVDFHKASDAALVAVKRFFAAERRKEGVALDWPTFSKRRNLGPKFETFWRSRANPSRARFDRSWRRFINQLDKNAA